MRAAIKVQEKSSLRRKYRHFISAYRTSRGVGILNGLAVSGVMASSFLAHPALAQTNVPHSSQSTDGSIGEIVVTAQHRKENAQTTPIALSVISGEQLKAQGISGIEALSASAPDLGFNVTEGKPVITIRGVSSRDTTENGDPAVVVNTDGFYLNRPYAMNASLYDLERVEVLRGPQGTLNGRNSVGGAINIVTAKPTDKFEGYASVQYGNYNDLETQGAINIPLGEKVQMRASFFTASHDGYRYNGIGGRTDDQDDKSGRLQIAFQPTERLHGLITLQYTKQGGQGDAMQNIPFVYNAAGQLVTDMPAGLNNKSFALSTVPYLDLVEKQVRGNLTYDFDGFQMMLLGGYDNTQWHHSVDQSNPTDGVFQFQENQYPKTGNEEIRFTSKNQSPFQWQFGGFFFQESSHLLSADAYPLATGGFNDSFGFAYGTKARSEAGYAQASYQLTPTIKATGGFRYTHDYKSETGYYGDLSAGVIYANQSGSTSSSKATYHAEIEDALSQGRFVYAKFDTGYKAGGFNFGGSSYAPESIKTFEIGSKNRFLDNRLQLNLAAYYSDYSNQQVSTYAYVAGNQPVQLTENAGKSHIYGIEGDLVYSLPKILRFNLNVNWLHARYVDFLSVIDPSGPVANDTKLVTGTQNDQLAGNTPPQSPTWSLSAGIEHDWHIFSGTLTGRIQTKYQSATNFSFYNYADTRQGAYHMSDLFLTYRPDASRWSVTGYMKNLENSTVFSDAEESEYAAAYAYEYYPPRTFGARIQYNW